MKHIEIEDVYFITKKGGWTYYKVEKKRTRHEYWLNETWEKHEIEPSCPNWKPFCIMYTYPPKSRFKF